MARPGVPGGGRHTEGTRTGRRDPAPQGQGRRDHHCQRFALHEDRHAGGRPPFWLDGGRGNDPHDLDLRPELLPSCHGLQRLEVPAGGAVSASVCRGRTSPSGMPTQAPRRLQRCGITDEDRGDHRSVAVQREGYRKVWARLRADGGRTAMRRVRQIMAENRLLAPQRPVDREEHLHDGRITTDRVDQMWGTDMTQTITTV
jgi:hypothetical protein